MERKHLTAAEMSLILLIQDPFLMSTCRFNLPFSGGFFKKRNSNRRDCHALLDEESLAFNIRDLRDNLGNEINSGGGCLGDC